MRPETTKSRFERRQRNIERWSCGGTRRQSNRKYFDSPRAHAASVGVPPAKHVGTLHAIFNDAIAYYDRSSGGRALRAEAWLRRSGLIEIDSDRGIFIISIRGAEVVIAMLEEM